MDRQCVTKEAQSLPRHWKKAKLLQHYNQSVCATAVVVYRSTTMINSIVSDTRNIAPGQNQRRKQYKGVSAWRYRCRDQRRGQTQLFQNRSFREKSLFRMLG